MTGSPDFAADWRLDGRIAVVTGAGSGIGAGSARVLAAAGATVVCADRNGPGAKATADAITAAGGAASASELDVTDRGAVFALAQQCVRDHGRLDVWCNVAGVIDQAPIADMSDEQFDRVFDVNFRGALYGCQAAVSVMAGAGRGSIVNIVSAAIDTPAPGIGAYAVSKAALAQLTKTLALEVGPSGVRVNAVAPGFIETAMTSRHNVRADGSIDEEARRAVFEPRRKQSPLGLIGQPEDIANAVLYLAADAARFVTGQTLRPNGGVAMPW